MQTYIIIFLSAAFAWRLGTLAVSIRNEIALKRSGAREYGAKTSIFLAASHLLFYLAAVIECSRRDQLVPTVSFLGILLYLASAVALVSVIRSLGPLWTIKLIIAPGHRVVRSGLFRLLRHPNYFLNIVPELIGLGLATNSYWTMVIGLPIYAVPLTLRIRQEEEAMREHLPDYA